MVEACMQAGRRRFEIQGHRGARGRFPENTLAGIKAAIALGVDAIEFDVAVTADGVAVVTHDVALSPDLARDPFGAWIPAPGPLIRDLSLAELGRYDVGRLRPGSPPALAHPAQAPDDGARIPTLAEVLESLASSGVRADAELKTLAGEPHATIAPEAMAELVIEVAERAGALHLLDLRAFDWRGLRHAARLRPGLPRTWLTRTATVADATLWWGCPLAGSVPQTVHEASGGTRGTWAPEHAGLTEAAIAEAHALGLRVVPWTVNGINEIATLIAWRADGVCTDRPDLARQAMRAAGLVPPTPPG